MPVALILFILIPIAEMLVLIEVGSRIGALATIGLVLLTAVIGVALLKQQGFATLARANQRMQSGELPAQEMAEGIFLAVGGALLLTPGFITDTVGLLCLIPGVRQWLLGRLLGRWQLVQVQRFRGFQQGGPFQQGPFGSGDFRQQPPQQPRKPDAMQGPKDGEGRHTIEGDWRRDDE